MEPYLADFGQAKYFNYETKEKEFTHSDNVCTRTYRSPELYANRKYNLLVDEWSLGVVFYELFTNQIIKINSDMRFAKFFPTYIKVFCQKQPNYSSLINGLLTRQASKRMSAKKALKLPLFIDRPKIEIMGVPKTLYWPTQKKLDNLIIDDKSTEDNYKNRLEFTLQKMFSECFSSLDEFLLDKDVDFCEIPEYIEYEKKLFKSTNYNYYSFLK